jgi:hypothetical protein
MASAKQTSPGTFLVERDQPRLGTARRIVVAVLAAVANLVGWVVGRLTLLDDWAYCDQFPDGCEAHMLAFPVLIALWLSMLIGVIVVFGLAVVLSKVRLVPAWFPSRLVFPLAIYFVVQGAVSVPLGILAPVLLVPGYLVGPPLAVLFTRVSRALGPTAPHLAEINGP